jgi:hypothetical protein
VLEGVGVSADAALDKMRLLALLVLGSKAKGSAVPFADIQAALDIPLEQVRQGACLASACLETHAVAGDNMHVL